MDTRPTTRHRIAMPPPPWRARLAVAAVFFANGAGFASLVPHVPSVQSALDLRPSVLGLALLAMAAGALCGIPLSGACSARFGSRAVVHITATAFFATLLAGLVHATRAGVAVVGFRLLHRRPLLDRRRRGRNGLDLHRPLLAGLVLL